MVSNPHFRRAGVVNHQRNRRIRLQARFNGADTAFFAQVCLEHVGPDAVLALQLLGEGLQTFFPTCDQNQVIAASGETFGIEGADAGRCAGNQSGIRRGRHGVTSSNVVALLNQI